jgi:hypothetical protein
MHFETYDSTTGQFLGPVQQLNFGDLIQNQHCVHPIVLRAVADQDLNVSNVQLALTSKGSWVDTDFGYYTSPNFISIESGSNYFKALSDSTKIAIGWNGTASNYVWLDAQIHNVIGFPSILPNFRLLFDHS